MPNNRKEVLEAIAKQHGKTVAEIESVIAKANCGCVGHAEENLPCKHDLALLK